MAAKSSVQATQLRRRGRHNRDLGAADVERDCALDAAGRRLLKLAIGRYALSARAIHRVQKSARTIADLAGEARIAPAHVAEALSYRVG